MIKSNATCRMDSDHLGNLYLKCSLGKLEEVRVMPKIETYEEATKWINARMDEMSKILYRRATADRTKKAVLKRVRKRMKNGDQVKE